MSPKERATLVEENDNLRRERDRLNRVVAQRDATIASQRTQIGDLKGFGSDRPVDLFAPVKLEIASRSRGADYDDKPGDDGVTVHLRPRDQDGHVVKAPGRIKIQLTDNTVLGSPRVLGLYSFDDPEQLRKLWHGRFGTQHYTLKCPLPSGVALPESRKVVVHAEFVDYLTGSTLTAVEEVAVSPP